MKSNDLALAKLKDFGNNVSGLTINEAKVFLQRVQLSITASRTKRLQIAVRRSHPVTKFTNRRAYVCVFYPAPSEGWEPSISK